MKKRTSFFVLLVVLIFSTIISQAQQGLTINIRVDLAMRVGPSTEWNMVTVIPAGTPFTLEGRTGDLTWVRGVIPSGHQGWILAEYAPTGFDQIAALPIVDRTDPFSLAGAPSAPSAESAPAETASTESSAPPPAAVSAPPGGGVSITVNANMNIRSGPSTEYRRVGGISINQEFLLDGTDASRGWVRGISPDGTVGWVAVNFTSININQLTNLPIVDVSTPFGLSVPSVVEESAPESAPETATNINPVVGTTPVTGFAFGGQVFGWSSQAENYMRLSGMTWVKRQVRHGPGADPGSVAGTINEAHARGFRVLLSVIGIHSTDEGYFNEYANFVGGLAGLGADAIEVWNEQNIDREWPSGQIDPGRYTQLLAKSFNAIKSSNPNTLVISGAPAPTGFFGGCHGGGCDDAPFVSGMAAAGAARFVDCIGIHYNEGIISPNQTSGDPRGGHYTRYFWGMVNAYSSAFGNAKPLCFTEIGYLSPEGYGPLPGSFAWAGGTSSGQQAAWLDQALALSRSSGRVKMFIVWNMDATFYGADPMGGYAIIRPDGSCPACSAFSN